LLTIAPTIDKASGIQSQNVVCACRNIDDALDSVDDCGEILNFFLLGVAENAFSALGRKGASSLKDLIVDNLPC